MKFPVSPCHSCPSEAVCPDGWYGCPRWRLYFSDKWPAVTTVCTRPVRFLRLYLDGLNDREIADCVGVSPLTVFNWRHRRGLSANGKRGPKSTQKP